MAILKGTKKAMIRVICGIKLMTKRSCEKLMDLLVWRNFELAKQNERSAIEWACFEEV